jgi:hypothetical protein
MRGLVAGPQQAIRRAGDAISLTQTFGQALAGIRLRLTKMQELAYDGDNGDQALPRVAQIRGQLEALAAEINDITANTEFTGNRLFGSDGQSMQFRLTDRIVFNFRSRDFSFRLENDSLFEDFKTLHQIIKAELKALFKYDDFLLTVSEQAQEAMSHMQGKLGDIMEVNTHVREKRQSLEINAFSIARVMEEAVKALAGHANVSGSRAFELLTDKSE